MCKNFLRTCIMAILTYTFYVWVETVGGYSNAGVEEIQITPVRMEDFRTEKSESGADETERRPMKKKEEMGNQPSDSETTEEGTGGTEDQLLEMEKYYGAYLITEFRPTIYYRHRKWDVLPEQEADMMLGRIVRIEEDLFRTYDSERSRGTREGRQAFPGNYMIKEFLTEDPQYAWTDGRKELNQAIESIWDGQSISKQECNRINGRIDVSIGHQDFYTMEGEDKLILYSWLTHQYFILEKINEMPEEKEAVVLTREEKEEILGTFYGEYKITEFLPTKFYPAKDVSGIDVLPQGEADMMIGKEVVINANVCTVYDNCRQPNSEYQHRAEDEYLLEKVEISQPDYEVENVIRDEIYGLRDDMLPEGMEQDEYTQISVYPGFQTGGESVLPQFYLLEDGRVIMYSMGEYFMLEKVAED